MRRAGRRRAYGKIKSVNRLRVLTVIGSVVCAAGVALIFAGRFTDRVVGNANVVGGMAGVAGLCVALLSLTSGGPRAVASSAKALEHLAEETLFYWRQEAKARQVTTPVPAAVRWRWARSTVAARPDDIRQAIDRRGLAALGGGVVSDVAGGGGAVSGSTAAPRTGPVIVRWKIQSM